MNITRYLQSAFYALVGVLLTCGCSRQEYDPWAEKSLNELVERIGTGSYDRQDEEALSRALRQIALHGDEEERMTALLALGEMRKALLVEFPAISLEVYEESHHSVGHALFKAGHDSETVLSVLLREDLMLSASAGILLNIMYEYPIEGYPAFDRRILANNERMAAEGWPRALYQLGRAYYHGRGVRRDRAKALSLLEQAPIEEAYMLLLADAIEQGDDQRLERFARKAIDLDSADAHYNMAIFRQRQQRYPEAMMHLRKTLEIDPEHYAAMLERGRMFVEGWGVNANPRRGVAMIHRVADEASGRVADIAKANLGFFYLEGIGVEKDPEKAAAYLTEAAQAGIPEAIRFLNKPASRLTR